MTTEELKQLIETSVAEATKNLTEENKKFVEDMEKQLAEMKQPADKKDITKDNEDPKAGFYNFADFAKSAAMATVKPTQIDKRLIALQEKAAGAGLTETVDSEGGFLIPTEFSSALLKLALEKSNFMAKCTSIPMGTNSVSIPYIRDVDRSGGLVYGAIKLYWVAEEAEKTQSKPKFGTMSLNLHELIGLAYTSNQILEDSPVSMEPLLKNCFSSAFAWTMDEVILNGTGAGQPRGVMKENALISVAKESGQTADTIVFENIVKMESRLLPQSEGPAIYIANKDTFPQIATMSIKVGTGGIPVYLPANGASGKPFGTLMGRELIFTEHCQTIGDKGDILLTDFAQYLLGEKKGRGVISDSSIHLKFDYDQTAFRFTFRIDGQSWLPAAVTPRHSSNTLSSFITVAERA